MRLKPAHFASFRLFRVLLYLDLIYEGWVFSLRDQVITPPDTLLFQGWRI